MLEFLLAMLWFQSSTPSGSFQTHLGGASVDRGVDGVATHDGGFVVVGSTERNKPQGEDVLFVKTDGEGHMLWDRTWGGNREEAGWSIHEEKDGNLVVAGFTQSFGAGGFDCFFLRTDSSGKPLEVQTFGDKEDDRCWALRPLSDGGYVLVGESGNIQAERRQAFILRLEQSGKLRWHRRLGTEGDDRMFSVAETKDGDLLALGQTYGQGAGDRDVYLMKIDSSGKLLWTRTYGGPKSDVGHSIARLEDDGFLITGYTSSFSQVGDDPYLHRLDPQGNLLWSKVLPLPGHQRTLTGVETADGQFVLSGYGENRSLGTGGALIVHTSASGELLNANSITKSGRATAYTIRALPLGGYLAVGHMSPEPGAPFDVLLRKSLSDDSSTNQAPKN